MSAHPPRGDRAMPTLRHTVRTSVVLLAMGMFAFACGSEGSSNNTTSAGSSRGSAAPANSVAQTLVLGGPPECPERPYCLKGLQDTYGLKFKEFSPLDTAGPNTVSALKKGDIQV